MPFCGKNNNMEKVQIRQYLINSGVSNLKKFGYPKVNNENILTDEVYKMFFKSMLQENLGKVADKNVDEVINQILSEL